jgi:hypothetical protein
MANSLNVTLSKIWVAAFNLDMQSVNFALYPNPRSVILSLLSISMAYMTSGWISVDVDDTVLWLNNCFAFASILPQFKILTPPQPFVLFITFNSLALNQNVRSMNFIKRLSVCLITPHVEKSKFV